MYEEYTKQLIEEIECQSLLFREYQVSSIFVGGGTPSVLGLSEMKEILQALNRCFDLLPDAEITVEANPGTLSLEGLLLWREMGVNRLSIGLQTADNRELRCLGRIHTWEQFLGSYQSVRTAGFKNVNVDLMFGVPGQTLESWKNTLKQVVRLKPEHISAYGLIVEEDTPYYGRYCGESELEGEKVWEGGLALPDLPDEDMERAMYSHAEIFLQKQGYEHYEISNYGKPGFACKHNIGYWTGTEYLGLGLGASSYVKGCRFHNTRNYQEYVSTNMKQPEKWKQVLRQDFQELSVKERMEEFMFLGLRLVRGVSAVDFAGNFGQNIRRVYGGVLDTLAEKGLMEQEGDRYFLTPRGAEISNYVMSYFLF